MSVQSETTLSCSLGSPMCNIGNTLDVNLNTICVCIALGVVVDLLILQSLKSDEVVLQCDTCYEQEY